MSGPSAGVPGYVLAGGRSTRMGQSKALVLVAGRPMAVRVARAMLDAGVAPVHVVGKDPGLARLGLPFIPDGDADHHPLVGVCAALDHAATLGARLALVAPTDLPLLGAAAVATLLRAGRPAVARSGDRRQPLLALLSVDLRGELRRAARAGGSVHAAMAALPAVELPAEVLRNVNAPGDIPELPPGW